MNDKNNLTLSITRKIDAPRSIVWRCWTEAELLKRWYVPKPWVLAEADLDVTAGGRFNSTMAGPDGERMELEGCFLEVTAEKRLIFSDSYKEGFMPNPESFMTGVVELSDADDGGTMMVWSARHSTEEKLKQHLDMGFEDGWNKAADQLNELVTTLQ